MPLGGTRFARAYTPSPICVPQAGGCDVVDCDEGTTCIEVQQVCLGPGCEHPIPYCVPLSQTCAVVDCAGGTTCQMVSQDCDGPGCEYPVAACVPTACTFEECGDPPPSLPCADGSGGDVCGRGSDGTCGWSRQCPGIGEACMDGACLGDPPEPEIDCAGAFSECQVVTEDACDWVAVCPGG